MNKNKLQTILKVILILFIGNIFILNLLPKLIAFTFLKAGFYLDSSNLMTKYLMGIFVRTIGCFLFIFILKKQGLKKIFHMKVKRNHLILSWMFYLYIIANLELVPINTSMILTVILMILDSLMVGIYEETAFRGVILPLILRKWGSNKMQILISVISSSMIFGLTHLLNLLSGASFLSVITQVIYATIMGIAFSALLLRTNWNLLWCILLHALYDMAGGFGDFIASTTVSNNGGIISNIINLAFFLPLFVYGLLLLRKIKSVDENGRIEFE